MSSNTKSKKISTATLTKIAILSAISFLLSFLEVNIPIFPAFLKFDFADVPAVVALLTSGPFSGVMVVLIKNLLCLTKTSTLGVGDLANFLMGTSFILTLNIFYGKNKNIKSYVIGCIFATIVMSIVGGLLNYFVLIPLYSVLFMPMEVIMEMAQKVNSNVTNFELLIVFAVIPFNIVKGLLISISGYIIYKAMGPVLKSI